MILYAIGDIHGCLATLTELLDKVEKDRAGRTAKYVFLGDYVDRGPDSAGVVELIVKLQTRFENVEVVCLRGNHEQMMLDFTDQKPEGEGAWWIPNGGKQTIESYENFDGDHSLFYRKLQWMHRHGDVLFVHAGINPNILIEEQNRHTLLWDRSFNDHFGDYPENVFVVHGHTPVSQYDLLQNQLNIDTGCVFARAWSEEYKWLTCVKIESPDDKFKNDGSLKFSFIQSEFRD
jgi:serine/threonine protein phosphatase 1